MTKDSPDTVIKVHFHPGDTARDVYEKFNAAVASAKDEMQNSGVDDAAGFLTSTPRLVLRFVVGLVKLLDYFGLAPKFLLELSPFHASVYFTSMGSLGIRPVYHHLYDFGTVPAFCAFGRKRRAEEIKDGEVVEHKYMDLRCNLQIIHSLKEYPALLSPAHRPTPPGGQAGAENILSQMHNKSHRRSVHPD